MKKKRTDRIIDLPELRNRIRIFHDRASAGRVLAGMLERYRETDAIVLAVPAGGIAVGTVIAEELNLPLDVTVVSKITLPWNTEAGYGAVAFDSTVLLNEELLSRIHLTQDEIEQGIKKTGEKVARRMNLLRGEKPLPDFNCPVILVDDGLASGFTLRTAIEALHKQGCRKIILAVPTAHEGSLRGVVEKVSAVFCPNIRGGFSFAVADAYEHWRDLDEDEVLQILGEFKTRSSQ